MQNNQKVPTGSFGFVVISALIWLLVWILYQFTDVGWCMPNDVLCHLIDFVHSLLFIVLLGASLLVLLSVVILLSGLRKR